VEADVGRLEPLPATFAATRDALHRVAEEIVAPARKPPNEIALTITDGGFGTPQFEHEGRRLVVRVERAELVVDADGVETRKELTTIADGGALVGAELLPDGLPDDETPLDIDPVAAARLAAYYAFAHGALRTFRAALEPAADASEPILWPEHFDVAIEAGAADDGERANYGGSPGDEDHAEPYLYVGPWSGEVSGELWNGKGFTGAELDYAELAGADDPKALAAEFFESRRSALAAG
jgi:hypothetical protein